MIKMDIRKSERCASEYAIFVSFPYSAEIIDIIRAQGCVKYWNAANKEWEFPIETLETLMDVFSAYQIQLDVADIDTIKEQSADIPKNFEFKTTPYDHQIVGLKFGLTHERWLLGDEQGLGKALALDTKVYTPNGFKLMKDLRIGDYVFGRDGKPTKVTTIYNHHNVEMYKITFSDGAAIKCCKDHLWKIYDQHGAKVVDTQWFTQKDQFGRTREDNLSDNFGTYKYWIDRCEPIQFSYQDVSSLNPYVLGALLGDGSFTSSSVAFSTADAEMIKNINDNLPNGYKLHSSQSMRDIEYNIIGNVQGKINIIKKALTDLGLMGTNSHTKFIPDLYKYNSISVRTQVLQGLLDTDGFASKDNLIQFTTVSKQLCDDVRFLVESLGGIVTYSTKNCGYANKITGVSHTLTIKFDRPQLYFTLTRKKELLHTRKFKPRRNIVAIEKIENSDARCITVENNEHLYVIENFVVTHNTKEVIDIAVAKKLQKGYKHCLIICGVNGLKWNWQSEVAFHSNEESWILGQTVKNHKTVIGGNPDKYNDLMDLLYNNDSPILNKYFLITNVESLRYKVDTGETTIKRGKPTKVYRYPISEAIDELCRQGIIEMIAFDEIHKCKDASSTQGSQLLELKAKTMIAMSGTPLMNKPMDLYVPLRWLGHENHSYYSFEGHYAIKGGYGGHEIVGYKNLDELQTKLDDIMLRRKKDEVLNLPEKIRINEYVEMTDKQWKVYRDVKAEISENIDLVKSAPNPLAALIRMRQATGFTGILSSTIKESAKLDRMEELVEESYENGRQVVIFSNWTQITDAVCERLKNYRVGVITGDTKDEVRQSLVNEFQNNKLDVMVGTIGAMGTGITLTAGTVEIFMDEPWNRANKEQAEDRCHRVGTKSNVTIYTLICKGTIDERINKLVEKKGAMADALVDGQSDMSKSDLIDYLLD